MPDSFKGGDFTVARRMEKEAATVGRFNNPLFFLACGKSQNVLVTFGYARAS